MYLIYTDECGLSFTKEKDGSFRDGPFFLYGGLSIDINKYEEIESSFKDLCKSILKINNIFETEIHAGDIFYKKGQFHTLTDEDMLLFFDEVLQLITKFSVKTHIGITYKDATIFNTESERIAASIHSFFYTLDSFLSKEGKRGLIIADENEETGLNKHGGIDYFKYLSDNSNLTGKKGGVNLSIILRRIFYERLNRFTEIHIPSVLNLKYKYESKMYFVLDNIHYVDSKLSVYTQLVDITLFITSIIFEVAYAQMPNISISRQKEIILDKIIRTVGSYFYNCVELAHLIKFESFYDVLYPICRGYINMADKPNETINSYVANIVAFQTK